MSRTLIPLVVSDTSAFAKSLRTELADHEGLPSHLQLLNMLARAAGFGNFQTLRANVEGSKLEEVSPPSVVIQSADGPVDLKLVTRVQRCFDSERRLLRWPSRRTDQVASLWILWSQLPSAQEMSERDVNALIKDRHLFGDHALLRRELCDLGLMTRTPDGSVYGRVERPISDDALAVMRQLSSK
ncbi:DUF2087 domain-containing protein (plasmid) [Rhizobium sp. CC1099]|uniref:DUF2087 domain-containing protein n=1 Tax=Rhizobium sp. CC1099 TaxID=3039160 RepID=UPI0024B1CBE6|nr:DUF2087 domain-containing protein [Rhizobium sp. CC1099]WFU90949.1 DUF2087 domain-containing protein [Rhizobium sp. CC1099]